MTVQGILSPGKHAMRRACQGEKKTAQRRKGLPARVLRIERRSNNHKSGKEGILPMAGEIFMRVNEVAEELGVSVPYAYKLIRELNKELRKTGCITIAGRIDRKFFHEKFYGTREPKERRESNGSV